MRLKVKEIAESQGYNMSSLSRATDIGINTIKRLWKKSTVGVNILTLEKIAIVLKVPIAHLYEDEHL